MEIYKYTIILICKFYTFILCLNFISEQSIARGISAISKCIADVTKCSVHLLVSPWKLIFFTYVQLSFLYFLAEDIESVPLHGMETYAARGTIILCVFSLFNNLIILWKSFGILYTKLILYNLVGKPEIQDGENAVSGGCGGDIVGGGGGGVKRHAGVYF